MQYGRLENGIIVNMPTSGMDENGCLFVVDGSNEKYALENGYKEVVYSEMLSDEQTMVLTEDETHIYVNWK